MHEGPSASAVASGRSWSNWKGTGKGFSGYCPGFASGGYTGGKDKGYSKGWGGGWGSGGWSALAAAPNFEPQALVIATTVVATTVEPQAFVVAPNVEPQAPAPPPPPLLVGNWFIDTCKNATSVGVVAQEADAERWRHLPRDAL